MAPGRARPHGDARVLLVRGDGKCFSAGAEVAEHLPEKVRGMFAALHALFERVTSLEIPIVSAIHGNALGGGFELALFSDIIYATASAKIGLPEIKLGVFAPYAAAILPGHIGGLKSMEILLTGRTVSGEEAHRLGLVNAVAADEVALWKMTDALASELAALSLPALRSCKAAIRHACRKDVGGAVAEAERIYLEELMRRMRASQDYAEGPRAFAEKRKPVWKNN